MPGGRFSKQASWIFPRQINNNNANDTVIGGALTGVPAGQNGPSQGFQTLPGDRAIFSPSDALAYSNNNIANLNTGTYRYVQFRNNSTSNVVRAHFCFLDNGNFGAGGNNDGLYQCTADGNQANTTNTLPMGVAINNITLNNGTAAFWWLQESGKAACKFIGTLSGNGGIGTGGYLAFTAAANNNANDNGSLDSISGSNAGTNFSAANTNTAFTQIDLAIVKFVGVQETAATNNNISQVDLRFSFGSYRW